MAGPQLRIATLLLLLMAIVCSCSVGSVAAEAALKPDSRLLRHQVQQTSDTPVQQSVTTTTTTATASHSSSSSSSSSGSGSGSFNTTATINTEASAAESTESAHHGPTTMSFVGPAIAGVLAIVLIGAVVAFKNRMGK